jgi:hypothetical protein
VIGYRIWFHWWDILFHAKPLRRKEEEEEEEEKKCKEVLLSSSFFFFFFSLRLSGFA